MPTLENACETRRLQLRRLPLSARTARKPCRRPMNRAFRVAVIASGDSGRHVSAFHDRSAPVVAVTDARLQRAAPPTRLNLPARYTTWPAAATPVAIPLRTIGWKAVRRPVRTFAPKAS